MSHNTSTYLKSAEFIASWSTWNHRSYILRTGYEEYTIYAGTMKGERRQWELKPYFKLKVPTCSQCYWPRHCSASSVIILVPSSSVKPLLPVNQWTVPDRHWIVMKYILLQLLFAFTVGTVYFSSAQWVMFVRNYTCWSYTCSGARASGHGTSAYSDHC